MSAIFFSFIFVCFLCSTQSFNGPFSSNSYKTKAIQTKMSVDPKIDYLISWSKKQSLQSIAPKPDVETIIQEIRASTTANDFWDLQYANYSILFDKFESAARRESRTISTILGSNTTTTILNVAEKVDIFDPQSVNTLLRSPAFEEIIGTVIYEAILTFLEKADVLGNIVNTLPIIGPIRKQINEQLKRSLDQTLGKQIRSFLIDYNRVAISRIIELVLTKENRTRLSKTNRSLISALLSRPVSSYLPSSPDMMSLKNKVWEGLRGVVSQADVEGVLADLYESSGTDILQDFVDVDALLALSPRLRYLLDMNVNRLVSSEEGLSLIKTLG